MRNVMAEEPPQDYIQRHINRWYSEKFHTPLHEVDELPRHDVLLTYYECCYADMRDGGKDRESELDETIQGLINPRDLGKEEAAKVDDYLFLKKVAEEEAKKSPIKLKPKMVVSPIDLDEEGPVSMTFADINKLDELEEITDSLVGLD